MPTSPEPLLTVFQDPPIPPDLRDLPDLQGCRKKIPGLQDLLGPKDLQDQQVPPDLQAHRVPRGPKVQQDRKEQKVTPALQVQQVRQDRKVIKAIRVRRDLPEPQDPWVLQDHPDLQDPR